VWESVVDASLFKLHCVLRLSINCFEPAILLTGEFFNPDTKQDLNILSREDCPDR